MLAEDSISKKVELAWANYFNRLTHIDRKEQSYGSLWAYSAYERASIALCRRLGELGVKTDR